MNYDLRMTNFRDIPLKVNDSEDLNEILRGELSAVEAYEQVLEKVHHYTEAQRLIEFHDDHEKACRYWEEQIYKQGDLPTQTSSIWGAVVEAFVGVSKILGEHQALAALKDGEEHGLYTYRKMLDSDQLNDVQKIMIRDYFIPNQEKHIRGIKIFLEM